MALLNDQQKTELKELQAKDRKEAAERRGTRRTAAPRPRRGRRRPARGRRAAGEVIAPSGGTAAFRRAKCSPRRAERRAPSVVSPDRILSA